MGKKRGQQQRTKGNVLPSSSVRSADLLAKEGGGSGVGVYQSIPSAGLGNIPELVGLDTIANIEFRAVLKKLYKRDVTTKLKGLAEFSDLCGSCKEHEVLTVLPYWPRVYNRLFEDGDRRVRENSQKAMHAMVLAAGKNLALQLKNVMGCWFVSQCDPYEPSSLAAETSISKAFSGDKKVEAFTFCRKEILKFIASYLFGPQAKREKGSEQDGNNYHRIMASCLEAFSLFIRNVARCSPVDGEIESILNESKFWKFQKHTSMSVRGGYYSVIESLCLVFPDLVNAHLSEACKSVFHRLDESNIAVCKPLYAAAVALVVKCTAWHEEVDFYKGVIPGLCGILKSGCYGLGAYVLPTLLPIIAKIPNSVDLCLMFSKIFEAMRICIGHVQVKPSKHGSELAITAYFEILRLSISRIVKEVTEHDVKEKFSQTLVTENILYILEESFMVSCNKFSCTLIYRLVSSCIHSWSVKKAEDDADELYEQLCKDLWDRLGDLIHKYALIEDNLVATKLIVQFIDEMLHFQTQMKKPQRRSVKFEQSMHSSESLSTTDAMVQMPMTPLNSNRDVQGNVNKIVASRLLSFPWKETKTMICVYKEIFEKLGNRDLFERIYDDLNIAEDEHEQCRSDKVASFIERILVKEIRRIVDAGKDWDKVSLEMFSDIIFHTLRHCNSQKKFPFNFSCLLETKSSNPYFVIALGLLSTLVRYACSYVVIAGWLHNLLADSENSVWIFLHALADCVSECRCVSGGHSPDIDLKKSWKLLQDVLTQSFAMPDGVEVCYLSDEESFILVVKKLLSNMESSKTCLVCYRNNLCKVASILLSCVETERKLDFTQLGKEGQNIWINLMTDLLREHCSCQNSNTELLSCFLKYFSHAVRNSSPFDGANSVDIVGYLGIQAAWMKINLMSRNADDFSGLIENWMMLFDAMFEIVTDIPTVLDTILINLLPSSIEWESLRGLSNDVIASKDLELLDADTTLREDSSGYFSLLCTFRDVTIRIAQAVGCVDVQINWGEQKTLLDLGEELSIAAAIKYDVTVVGSFIQALGAVLASKLRLLILEKSIDCGNIWAHCAQLLGPEYGPEEWDLLCTRFDASYESSEISVELFQTVSAVLEHVPNDGLRQLNWLARIRVFDPENIPASDIFLFSLAVLATRKQDSETRQMFVEELLEIVMKWRSQNEKLFAFDEDFASCPEEHMLLNSSVAELFAQSVKTLKELLTESQWDFILCSLLSWMENISKSVELKARSISLMSLMKNSCILLQAVNNFMSSLLAKEDPTIPSNLLHEWSEFFSVQINAPVVKIFVSLSLAEVPMTYLKEICRCLRHASAKSVIAAATGLKPKLSPDSTLPQEVQTILNRLCPMFLNKYDSVIRHGLVLSTSYGLIDTILENLIIANLPSPPDPIMNILKRLSKDVESIFVAPDVEVTKATPAYSEESDEDFEVEELDDAEESFRENLVESVVPVLAYLLTWKLLINLTRYVSAEKKPAYIDNLFKGNDVNLSEDLLPKIFRIMIGKKSHFSTSPDIFFESGVNLEGLEHIAASIYQDFLVQMPAVSRSWFNDLTKSVRTRVDKFTSTHVSPVLIEREVKAVQMTKQQQVVEGMEINARPGAREVHATYKLNDVQMEIAVRFSPNHPLGPINVETEKRAGVLIGQWRYWLLQITTFLQYRNGGIIDGLLLWKDKVDKRFEGMEECMICFSIVHGSSQSLPKLKCKTCKKKYHAECLYKWFDTSNNSTCPLCRTPMIFR